MKKLRISIVGLRSKREDGFSYAALLALVAVIGVFAGITTQVTSRAVQAAKEKELLFRGMAYVQAIGSYYQATQGYQHYPPSLEDLVKDPRFPNRHHIRRLYLEPMNESLEWRLIRAVDGGISGVCSPSDSVPIKKSGFPVGLEEFEAAEHYSDWCFEYSPGRKYTP